MVEVPDGPDTKCHTLGTQKFISLPMPAMVTGWKGLRVEIPALRSIIKPLEPFGHKRGQLPWLDS